MCAKAISQAISMAKKNKIKWPHVIKSLNVPQIANSLWPEKRPGLMNFHALILFPLIFVPFMRPSFFYLLLPLFIRNVGTFPLPSAIFDGRQRKWSGIISLPSAIISGKLWQAFDTACKK